MPGHGLPADLSAAAGLYPPGLGLPNNLPPGLGSYARGLVSVIVYIRIVFVNIGFFFESALR